MGQVKRMLMQMEENGEYSDDWPYGSDAPEYPNIDEDADVTVTPDTV